MHLLFFIVMIGVTSNINGEVFSVDADFQISPIVTSQ